MASLTRSALFAVEVEDEAMGADSVMVTGEGVAVWVKTELTEDAF